ncbi:hypothetical protein LINPERPRIM_LOCUS20044 [Linum perenne]
MHLKVSISIYKGDQKVLMSAIGTCFVGIGRAKYTWTNLQGMH